MAIRNLKTTRDFARIWFYWKIPAIIVFLVIVIGICLYFFTQTPLFEANAKILLLPKTNDELVVNAGQGQRQYDIQAVDNADINTEIELIKSNAVLSKTIAYFKGNLPSDEIRPGMSFSENPDLDKEVRRLIGKLEIEPVHNSNMISVTLDSPDQERVADVLNKMMEIYIDYHKHVFSKEESEEFYNSQKDFYAKKLQDARDSLKAFNLKNNIANMTSQINANIGLITQFNGELQNLQVAIAENEAKIRMLEKGLRVEGKNVVLSSEMRRLPVIAELARGLVPLLIKRTEISKTFTRQSREYRQIDDQIAMLRDEIKNESLKASQTNNIELAALKIKQDALKKRMEYLQDQNKEFDLKRQELSALELDEQIAKKNYLLYGSKSEDSRLYAMRNKTSISNVVVAEPAVRPDSAKSPKKMLAFQVALFLGLVAALLLPFVLETLDHKLKTADDIESAFSVPVVCTYREIG